MDAAQGRPMVVVNAPDETVREWSEANNYDLLDNYANSKFDPTPTEPVVECVYVSDVRSEPSKTYTFPASRVWLIDAHHADDGRRLADRVAVETLAAVMQAADEFDDVPINRADVGQLARYAGIGSDVVSEALELADVERTIGEAEP
jgi:predicted GNAT family acetyltransferase